MHLIISLMIILNKCDGVSDRAIYTDAIASKKGNKTLREGLKKNKKKL